MYYVVQPYMSQHDPQCWRTAPVVSRHRTIEAAKNKIDQANKRMNKGRYFSKARKNWYVVDADFNLVQRFKNEY